MMKNDLTDTVIGLTRSGEAFSGKDIKNYPRWKDDLTSVCNSKDDDIVKIYRLSQLDLIWEREEITLNNYEKSLVSSFNGGWLARDRNDGFIDDEVMADLVFKLNNMMRHLL